MENMKKCLKQLNYAELHVRKLYVATHLISLQSEMEEMTD